MVKTTEIITYQGFGEWVCKIIFGVYLPHPQNIVGNMLTGKMLANHHGFLVQCATRISWIQHHTHVVQKHRCRFRELDTHWSKVILDNNIILNSLLQRYELGTKCWGLHRGLGFQWPCSGCYSHHQRKKSYRSTSDLVVYTVGNHTHTEVHLIKKRFRKLLIKLLIKACILIYEIISHLNLLIININSQPLWVNLIPLFWWLLQLTKYTSWHIKMTYPRVLQKHTQQIHRIW